MCVVDFRIHAVWCDVVVIVVCCDSCGAWCGGLVYLVVCGVVVVMCRVVVVLVVLYVVCGVYTKYN